MGKFAKVLLIFSIIIVVFKSDIVQGGRSIKIRDDNQNFPGVTLSNIPYFLNIPKYPNFFGFSLPSSGSTDPAGSSGSLLFRFGRFRPPRFRPTPVRSPPFRPPPFAPPKVTPPPFKPPQVPPPPFESPPVETPPVEVPPVEIPPVEPPMAKPPLAEPLKPWWW